jgi:beta-phosphoglucomutase family hydrolase
LVLGLPATVGACLFDLDGVLTQTATIHAAAWKQMFDDFLRARAEREGGSFAPFTPADYERYVDGRQRLDGTRAFLASRGIDLPEGSPGDADDAWTVQGLSTRKNELVLRLLAEGKIEVFDGSVRYVEAVRAAGMPTAVVSSSANTAQVLEVTGMTGLFDVRIDGVVAQQRGLAGKPDPATFLAAARDLGVTPDAAAVFEDALAGVQAGRAGGFGCVVGVNRNDEGDALRQHGADIVVTDLSELLDPDDQSEQVGGVS